MSGWILPRVKQPLASCGEACCGGMVALMLGVAGSGLRGATIAEPDERLRAAVWVGLIAATCGAAMGAPLGLAARTFRGSTPAWMLPGAHRRVVRELGGWAVVACLVGAAIGAALTGGTWAMGATGSALGYGLAVLCTDPPAALHRVGGWGRGLGCAVPAYFMPDFAASGAWSVGFAFVAMWMLIAWSGAGVLARSDGTGERRAAEAEAVLFARAEGIIWRGLRGPDGFVGVRRNDRDWVRAAVHAMWGSTMGGLVRNAWGQPVLMVVLLEVSSRFGGGEPANQSFGEMVHSLLAGTMREPANTPVMSTGYRIPIAWAASCIATLAGLKVSMSGIPFDAMPRRQRARVLWLRTQLEEWVWALMTAICFAGWALVRSWAGDPSVWGLCERSLATMMLMMSALPVFRRAILQGYGPFENPRDLKGIGGDHPVVSGTAVGGFGGMSLVVGPILIGLINGEEAPFQAGRISGTTWLVLLGLVVASRVGWYLALRSHSTRADLVAAR